MAAEQDVFGHLSIGRTIADDTRSRAETILAVD